MATHMLYNAYVLINSVDLSDKVKVVRLNTGVEALDDTTMSKTTRINKGGLLTWQIDIDFEQDYASGKVDATISPLHGTTTAIEIRPDAGSVSTTNPKWTGTALVDYQQPVGGTVGEIHMAKVVLLSAGTLTRATS